MFAPFGGVNDPYDEEVLNNAIPNQLDKQITTLLGRLQSPWVCDRTDNRMTGYMYKRQRKYPHKWVLFRVVLNGNNLYYFADATSKRPRGIISVSFVSQKLQTTEAHLLEIKNPEVSKHYVMIFSPNRLDLFAAPSNEELDQWYTSLVRIINESLTKQEVSFRENVLQELLPLLAQKSSQDVERIMLMISELEHSGFSKGKVKKDRTGNMEMWLEDEEKWGKFYFVLQNRCLYYYKTSKAPPKGIITLQFTTIETETEAPGGTPYCFRLRTPLSNFILKAKHEVAMEEWINALEAAKSGTKKKDASKEEEKGRLLAGDFVEINKMADLSLDEPNAGYHKKAIPQVTYKGEDGKKKTLKLPLGITTIGRSDSCGITLEDKQVSRSHAKIEVSEAAAVLSDLGSGHGTRLNHQQLAGRAVLKNGDSISLGKTKLKFLVSKK